MKPEAEIPLVKRRSGEGAKIVLRVVRPEPLPGFTKATVSAWRLRT
jgi:hypothetical protein